MKRTTFEDAVIDIPWIKRHVTVFANGCWEWNHARTTAGYGVKRMAGKNVYLHRFTCEITYGPSNGLHALHSCDNPPCCNPAHLHWGTRSVNSQESLERGRFNRTDRLTGIGHHNARLNPDAVRAIREVYATGNMTLKELGKEYNLHFSSIQAVVKRKTWKEVA